MAKADRQAYLNSTESQVPLMNHWMRSRTQGGSQIRPRRFDHESLEPRTLLAGDVVISEFMAINESNLRDDEGDFSDWIELQNVADHSVDLEGWYLTDDINDQMKWRLPAVSIPQGGFLVVYASGKDRVSLNAPLHTNFKLDGDGEYLALIDSEGIVSTAFAPSYPAQSADVSFGFSADGEELGYFENPTPGQRNGEPSPDPARQVILTEIMYHPSSENSNEEFVELYNTSSRPIDLTGWKITGGIDFEFGSVTIPAGSYLVVAADPAAFATKYGDAATAVGPWTGQLSNRSDRLTLRDENGLRVDRVDYADEGDWADRELGPDDLGTRGWRWSDDHDGGGKSLELVNRNLPNEYGQNWRASLVDQGTPGRENSVDDTLPRPIIIDVEHSPAIPKSNETVLVTARIIANTPVDSVSLSFSTGEDFSVLPMRDDGQGGDILASDGIYTGVVPAQPDLTVVSFFVSAASGAATRDWPPEVKGGGHETPALYQVIDAFDVQQSIDEGLPTYFEVMTVADREKFTAINRRSDAEMNATFISVDNEGVKIRYNTGVRIRGSGSRRANPPNNRINIPSDRPWNGVTAINLNVDNIHNQVAGSALFRAYGLPAAEAKVVRMFSNGVDLRNGSFYAHLEPLNSDFAKNHYPNDSNGNLYKGRRPNESPPGGRGAGLAYFGPETEPYLSYTKLTNESEADYSDVIQLTDVLNNAPDETFIQDVQAVVDIEQWIRFFAMNAVISNTEGGLVNGDRLGDDYAMYRGIEDPRFEMIPHDLDSVLSNRTWSLNRWRNIPALHRLLNHPEIKPRYYAAVKTITNDFLAAEPGQLAIRQSLRPFGEGRINTTLGFIQQRADYINSTLLMEENRIETVYPKTDGLWVSDRDSIALHGTTHHSASSVTVNGQPATFITQTNQWELGSHVRTIVSSVAEWQYLDDGSDQGTAWKDPNFVPDATWKTGKPQFGYGDGDETTVLEFGDDPNNKHVTTYFRHEFNVPEAWRIYDLNLYVLRDDGVAIYINGQEVHRDNLVEDAKFDTLASAEVTGFNERRTNLFRVDPSVLVDGKNVMAVELHQASRDSADVSLRVYMTGRRIEDPGIPLNPGINSVLIESYSGPRGTGEVLAATTIDVWYDDQSQTEVSGVLPAGDTQWAAANGPYVVTSDVTIPAESRLIIEPGTTVYFAEGTELIVNGTLIANGTKDHRIQFTVDPTAPDVPDRPLGRETLPDGPPRWKGIHFVNSTSPDNSIAFADIEFAQDNNGSIGVNNSHARIDHVRFMGTHLRMIYGNNASMVVSNSEFPDMFPGDERPDLIGLDNVAEHIKIIGRTPTDGVLRIENNHFGTNKGHNDVIDADSNQIGRGPILQVIGNTFEGAGDELLDLGGDVFVYGNVFKNVFKDDSTSDRGYANAISTGDAGQNTIIVVAKNVFYDVDHAVNLKRNASTIFENNTVVRVHGDFSDRFGNPNIGSVINLFVDEPGASPGKGAYLARNIMVDVPRVFGNADLPNVQSELVAHDNVISAEHTTVANRNVSVFSLGTGNRSGDPRFWDIENLDFRLRPGSAATFDDGTDLGWLSPPIDVKGEPTSPSNGLLTQLTVEGAGIFSFQYRVNGGDWSDEIPFETPFQGASRRAGKIVLASLPDGEYTVEVRGRDFAGNWLPDIATSKTWTVQRQTPVVQINEVLADNRGAHVRAGAAPDVIELINSGTASIDLKGFRLSDRPNRPDKFVFEQETILRPGELLVLYADQPNPLVPGIHLGFSLNNEGEGVYLFAPAEEGQDDQVLDAVEFGNQLINQSIGRVGVDRSWSLTMPTVGRENIRANTGDASNLKINEWLAIDATRDDFVEIYNPDPLPVAFDGLSISDEIGGDPQRFVFPPLTFIAGQGFLELQADNRTRANHLPFTLSNDQEVIGLIDDTGALIDTALYASPRNGIAEGRLPDGNAVLTMLAPTPGWSNGRPTPGDFNEDSLIDVADVELQCGAVRDQSDDARFDLNRDGTVDLADMTVLIIDILNTSYGDTNLDGLFNSSDLVAVFTAGEYEDGVAGNSVWSEGDWNCDGDFGTPDLVVAFQNGRYTPAARPQAAVAAARASDVVFALHSHDHEPAVPGQTIKTANRDRRFELREKTRTEFRDIHVVESLFASD